MRLAEPITLRQLQEQVGGKIIGDPDTIISGINEIHKVGTGDLTYVDHEKYYRFVLSSAATVVLINKELEAPDGKALLVTQDPFGVYNSLALRLRPFAYQSGSISDRAHVADSAVVGEGTIIQPGVFVGKHARIGKNCIIHANVSIYDFSEIGDNTIIHANSVVGSDAFYFKNRGSHYEKMHTIGRAIIGNDVEIGSNVTIDSGVSGDTIIGDGSKLDSHIHIGHGVVVGKHCLLCAQVAIAGKTILGDRVTLYGKVGVSKALKIGDGAVVLASSNVGDDLEGGKTYFGSPAQEARIAWRAYAVYRKLPEIWEKFKSL